MISDGKEDASIGATREGVSLWTFAREIGLAVM